MLLFSGALLVDRPADSEEGNSIKDQKTFF